MAKLGDIFSLIRNGASIKQTGGAGGIPITRIETISNREVNRNKFGYAGIHDIQKYSDYILQNDDILMSHINSEKHLGKAAIYQALGNEQIIHGMNLLMLRANFDILYPKYALYYFETPFFQQQIVRITKKSVNQASFSVTELKGVEIPLPTLEIQRNIAKVLDKVSSLMAFRKQQLVKLDELVKARFVEMFGDLADPFCKYHKCTLAEACLDPDDIKCGPFGTQLSKDEYQVSGIAVWEIPQINSGFTSKPTHFLTEEKAKQLKSYSIEPGDIAMSRKGNVGKCGLFPGDYEPGIIHSDVLRIRVDSNRVIPCFMMHQLHFSRAIQDQIEMVSSGAIMAGVNVTKLKQIEVYIPEYELQENFTAFVGKIGQQKLTIQQSLDKLKVLKKSLMQEYFG